jgi:DNA-directed RNA polymerase specialized sigma24 family protein
VTLGRLILCERREARVRDASSGGRTGADAAYDAVAAHFRVHHRRRVGLETLLVDDRETAEDVVQDAFAGLYRRWRHLRDPDAAAAYLKRAVVNGGRDQLRRGRRSPQLGCG